MARRQSSRSSSPAWEPRAPSSSSRAPTRLAHRPPLRRHRRRLFARRGCHRPFASDRERVRPGLRRLPLLRANVRPLRAPRKRGRHDAARGGPRRGERAGNRQCRNPLGFLDPQVRLGVNLIGCPALEPKDFVRRKVGTTVGASLTVTAPLGQYNPSKLINLGTNRWAFKPELGFAQPLGDWVVEGVAGVWLFADNDDFYGGNVRTQDPLLSYQAHVVYNFTRSAWAAVDFTYYDGGATSVGGGPKSARQSNTRAGSRPPCPSAITSPCG